jgi:serine/threonine protein phosphatase PrpC
VEIAVPVAIVVLILIAFAIVRTWRTPVAKAPAKKAAAGAKSSAKPSVAKSKAAAKALPAASAFSEALNIPSFVDEGDFEVEITVVTASPESGSDRMQVAKSSDVSTVAMIYEDEAEGEEITSPVARILVSAEGQSDQGQVRKRNEDSLLFWPEKSLFAVADGMGGYEGGNVASALAVDTLKSAFESAVFDGKTESETVVPRRGREVACAIQMANQAVLAKSKTDPKLSQMGTTVVAARFSPNKQRVYIGHVGDSRCYRLRGNVLRQLTTDHTMEELGMSGPRSHDLFQAVGIRPQIMIDMIVDKPRADDIYLLCSDGLTKMAKDDHIRDILLGEPDLEAAVYALIELANDRGGKDNVTVILVKIVEHGALS